MRNSTRMVVLGSRLWRPSVLGSSLALWLDAADASTITLNGSTVSQWRDKSGNNRHASQASTANQPTYIVSGLNEQGILRYRTVDRLIFPTNYSMTGGLYAFVLMREQTGNIAPLVFQTTPSTLFAYLHYGNTWHTQFTAVSVPLTDGNWFINVFSSQAGRTSNGTLFGGASTNVGTFAELGSSSFATVPYNFAEFIWSNDLSTFNRQRLEGYLAHKWGLDGNLPSDHPFKFTPPLA